jgi:hypothetical protein
VIGQYRLQNPRAYRVAASSNLNGSFGASERTLSATSHVLEREDLPPGMQSGLCGLQQQCELLAIVSGADVIDP